MAHQTDRLFESFISLRLPQVLKYFHKIDSKINRLRIFLCRKFYYSQRREADFLALLEEMIKH